MSAKYDFGGWATRNDMRCSDGRTIRTDAFAFQDGETVPLVWAHQHNDPENFLGHALLENRPTGVYAYCSFNNNPKAKEVKELVRHGDVKSLSIFANQLKQKGGDVLHGVIKEVSIVMAGANPGAKIDYPVLQHEDGSEEPYYEEAIIHADYGIDFPIYHADADDSEEEDDMPKGKEETIQDVWDTFSEKQKKVAYFLIGQAVKNKGGKAPSMAHADEEGVPAGGDAKKKVGGETVQDVYDSLTPKQKKVLHYMIGKALESGAAGDDDADDEEVEHGDYNYDIYEGVESGMKSNVFAGGAPAQYSDTLTHDEMATIIADGKQYGSLKESFLRHAEEYGIENIDYLFPEAKDLNTPPEFIKRDTTWVTRVMSGVHHSPFSRIKSRFADITEDDARARGYIKGKLKKEEVFSLLKRATTPTTVYKKQKMDRDDKIDIVDFDVVAWLKSEMRLMLDEELARAFLFGDGRPASSDDKISETNIRPIVKDEDLFTIKYTVQSGNTTDETTKNVIRAAIKARKDYRGSGNPIMFISEDLLSEMLLLEDQIGHALYETEAALATKMRVRDIVTVPDEIIPNDMYALIVNLSDYNVGADKGGSINMFEDFDIDYNQEKYLIETRCSGALTKPYSAIVLKKPAGGAG